VADIFFAGIDLGSTLTKAVIVDEEEKIVSRVVNHTGADHRSLAAKVIEEARQKAGLSRQDLAYIMATGYGRINVPLANDQLTELSCHVKGVVHFFPHVRLAIDIGGQDAKGLKIKNGKLVEFVMSDKCAAGTGRFLEILATTLGLEIDDLGEISLKSSRRVTINSTCTVFAQQEVILQLTEGVPVEDILAGVHDAIAGRTARMVSSLKAEPEVVFTGGVAKNRGVVKALKDNLGCEIFVPQDPFITGALGAALLGKEAFLKANSPTDPK
jgi:(R)-2-hydroxyacyl-CoA dehydratese activating ATPase